jgi:hypothetical protein
MGSSPGTIPGIPGTATVRDPTLQEASDGLFPRDTRYLNCKKFLMISSLRIDIGRYPSVERCLVISDWPINLGLLPFIYRYFIFFMSIRSADLTRTGSRVLFFFCINTRVLSAKLHNS